MPLAVSTLESWLWDAACQLRGPLDVYKRQDYILPLIFLKRLSDVFEDEVARLADEFGDSIVAGTLADEDHALVRFYVPEAARWPVIARTVTGPGRAPGRRRLARMTYFAVIRERDSGWDDSRPMHEQENWDEHASFMNALVDDGFVVLGGPLGDGRS